MSSSLYNSYFNTVSTDRRSPPKHSKPSSDQQPPPKKLSKSFTRQLAKTLAPPTSKKKKNKLLATTKGKKKKPYKSAENMSKRAAAPESGGSRASSTTSKKTKITLPEMETDKDDQPFWEISGKRRLQLSEFKGTTMVGVREFYEKDGEALPGKKGISMTVEQFNTIVELLPQIERELKGKGIELVRPRYDGEEVEKEEEEEEDVGDDAGDDADQDERGAEDDAGKKEDEEGA